MKKETVKDLKRQLVFAEARTFDADFRMRMRGRDDVERLKARIVKLQKRNKQ